MKKRIYAVLGIIVLGLCGLWSFESKVEEGKKFDYEMWGKALNSEYEKDQNENFSKIEDKIYILGESAKIMKDELDRGILYYKSAGKSDEDAKELAATYFMQYEAMYEKAIEDGYSVDNKEIEEQVEYEKTIFHGGTLNELSKNETQKIMDQFESEDAYWEFQKKVYTKQLPIQYMVSDIEKKYFSENPDATEEEWIEFFEQYKYRLVKDQKYTVVEESEDVINKIVKEINN